MAVWDSTVGPLVTAGHHVLRYDLFGRGFSDKPRGSYDLALFERQLDELLHTTGLDGNGPVDLVGSSMGAIVASRFAVLHPDRVRKVVLIGPAGFPIETSPIAALISVPVVGNWAMAVFGDRTLSEHNRRYYVAPEKFPEARQAFHDQLEYRGYKAAILSTMRHMPMNDFTDGYRALGALGKPVLLVWGKEDRTFPFSNMETAKGLVCPHGCDVVAVDAAAHLPQYERPDVVNPRLVEFLAR
jgi:pimeloyl-ACP methyl ester carboxylesterase